MRSEREPGRYEPLNETHRRVAEEAEKRRVVEHGQGVLAQVPSELEPRRPGTSPEEEPSRPDPEAEQDSPEARLAAKEKELAEKVQLGRITQSEMIYELQKFDNQLMVERTAPQASPWPGRGIDADRDGSSAEMYQNSSASPQRDAGVSEPVNESRADASVPLPQTSIEREAEAAEYEVTGRGEMTDARAARLERLRSTDRTIERESLENEGTGPDLDHDSGDRSR